MIGLIALIAPFAVAVRFLLHGDSWPLAILLGVKHALLGVVAIYGALVVLAVGIETGRAITHPAADAMLALLPDAQPPASRAGQQLVAPQAGAPAAATEVPPTPTPRVIVAHAPQPRVSLTPISLAYEAMGAAHLAAPTASATRPPAVATPPPTTRLTTLPTATPEPARSGCDPAYPEARTCIPPGPPWDQGCAITAERRFTVRPPDPQGLDHDGDGIGCEPIA
ncbi:MAG: hypothetical protein R2853_09330 [Thermomicrobiales bacterium]